MSTPSTASANLYNTPNDTSHARTKTSGGGKGARPHLLDWRPMRPHGLPPLPTKQRNRSTQGGTVVTSTAECTRKMRKREDKARH